MTRGTADACGDLGCHADSKTNLTTLHPAGCSTCHSTTVRQQVKDAIAANNKTCAACHSTLSASHSVHASTDTTDSYEAKYSATVTAYTVSIKCSTCHGTMDLMTRHGGASSCTKCHPSPASTANVGTNFACTQSGCHLIAVGAMEVKHAGMDASHTVTATGCSATGCHQTNLAAIHGRKKCSACHSSAKPMPTRNCAATGCHPTVTLASHMPIHNECNYCHADMRTWHGAYGYDITTASNCAECHGTPGTTAAYKTTYQHWGCDAWSCHY